MHGFKQHFAIAVLTIAVSSILIVAAQAPAGQRGGQRGAAQQGGGGRGRGAPAPARGLEVAGEVQNFVPVTDAMLRNPDPGNWPMIRRDYN